MELGDNHVGKRMRGSRAICTRWVPLWFESGLLRLLGRHRLRQIRIAKGSQGSGVCVRSDIVSVAAAVCLFRDALHSVFLHRRQNNHQRQLSQHIQFEKSNRRHRFDTSNRHPSCRHKQAHNMCTYPTWSAARCCEYRSSPVIIWRRPKHLQRPIRTRTKPHQPPMTRRHTRAIHPRRRVKRVSSKRSEVAN
ncbi:hypothetical protein M011DRAFT_233022 [Sporormia fimetaria CBS 119925]|uniref:Uncharacterized protein n=1 Tax=Sporormia fimetaria CBS 119925 TaxID=1340428 RepID=A0A6A6VK56_9PLEO|nr:hypothetical protein M011DRAFT_233022 [Sporormia fimetaria CBS 119925]